MDLPVFSKFTIFQLMCTISSGTISILFMSFVPVFTIRV